MGKIKHRAPERFEALRTIHPSTNFSDRPKDKIVNMSTPIITKDFFLKGIKLEISVLCENQMFSDDLSSYHLSGGR